MRGSFATFSLALLCADQALASSFAYRAEADENAERVTSRIACGTARDLLTRSGYRDIEIRSCFTVDYSFIASRDGRLLKVYVDPQNGRIWEG